MNFTSLLLLTSRFSITSQSLHIESFYYRAEKVKEEEVTKIFFFFQTNTMEVNTNRLIMDSQQLLTLQNGITLPTNTIGFFFSTYKQVI